MWGVYSYFPGFSKSCSECSPPVVLSRMTVDDETSPILTFSETKKWLQHPDVPPPQRNWTSHFNTISSFFLVKERRWMPELQPLIFLGPVILVVLFRLVCGCSSHGSCNEGKKMKCIITFEG